MKQHLLVLFLSIFILSGSPVVSFTISNIPSSIPVNQEFSVDWSSQADDPTNVNIQVYDATRTLACLASEGSHFELSKVVSTGVGQGSVSFTAPHSGTYIICAFNFTNSSDPNRSVSGTSFFNSSVLVASLQTQTVTVTASPSPQTGASSSSNNDGAIIGGALGGFVALLVATILALFWLGRYRIVRGADNITPFDSKTHSDVESIATSGYRSYRRGGTTVESSSQYPSSPPAHLRSGGSERGWGSQSGPSEIAEETPPSYASVSGIGH
ncbi:hypothetical protein V5O48_017524 [Marasmius crinis-equi]|uniref:Uncharacterized protein n=1 Tax=Marasmius crinis-equi TaxID=585013 RepID=A0ABR3ENW4_9AGAR